MIGIALFSNIRPLLAFKKNYQEIECHSIAKMLNLKKNIYPLHYSSVIHFSFLFSSVLCDF